MEALGAGFLFVSGKSNLQSCEEFSAGLSSAVKASSTSKRL